VRQFVNRQPVVLNRTDSLSSVEVSLFVNVAAAAVVFVVKVRNSVNDHRDSSPMRRWKEGLLKHR
jgi:heme/copper-type cytochrome/quinol oxidase subunit 2